MISISACFIYYLNSISPLYFYYIIYSLHCCYLFMCISCTGRAPWGYDSIIFCFLLTPDGEQSNSNKQDWQMTEGAHPYFPRVPGEGWCCRLPRLHSHSLFPTPPRSNGWKQILVHGIYTQWGFWRKHKHMTTGWLSEHPPWVGGKRPWPISAFSTGALLWGASPFSLPTSGVLPKPTLPPAPGAKQYGSLPSCLLHFLHACTASS